MLYRQMLTLILLIYSICTSAQDHYFLDIRKEDKKVLYAGYENKIIVPKNSQLSATGASIAKHNDTSYLVKVSSATVGKEIEFIARRGKEQWKRTFRVKVMPLPVIVLGKAEIGEKTNMLKSTFLNLAKNDLAMAYPAESQIPFRTPLTAFNIELRVNGVAQMKESVNGSEIPKKIITLAQSLAAFEIVISEAKTTEFRVRLPQSTLVVK